MKLKTLKQLLNACPNDDVENIFNFIATAIVIASDNIRVDIGIIFLQFIFITYQIFIIPRKTTNNVK